MFCLGNNQFSIIIVALCCRSLWVIIERLYSGFKESVIKTLLLGSSSISGRKGKMGGGEGRTKKMEREEEVFNSP